MNEHLKTAGIVLNDDEHLERINEFFQDAYIINVHQKAVGIIKFTEFSTSLHIRQFQILPQYHNQGIGSRVLNVIGDKAKKLQLVVTLNVLLANQAQNLYKRLGFEIKHTNELEHFMQWQPK